MMRQDRHRRLGSCCLLIWILNLHDLQRDIQRFPSQGMVEIKHSLLRQDTHDPGSPAGVIILQSR